MTQKQLADHLGCDVKVVNRIVNDRTSVGVGMALKLGAALRATPEFWLNAQSDAGSADRRRRRASGSRRVAARSRRVRTQPCTFRIDLGRPASPPAHS